MSDDVIAFDRSIPIDRFQGAEVEALFVGSITLTLELTERRRIHLDYQGCIEERDAWICRLPLCGEDSLMALIGQTITVEFASADQAFVRFSDGGVIELVRDAPGVDLVRFCVGEEEYQA
jgi:hypothetical protein